MHALSFLQDLAVVMIVAGVVTLIFHRLRQPVVLGYIMAGVIIGPHTLPFPLIQDKGTIDTLAELGIVFLLFSLGLEFNLRKLKAVGVPASVAALFKIVMMVAVGYGLGRWFGWSGTDSLFLGAIMSISSTTIIVKILGDLGLSRERFAGPLFGMLIIEDVLAIIMIALLSGIAMTGSLAWLEVGRTVGRLSIFLVVALVTGLIAVPRILQYVAQFKSNEMLLVTVLGLCFGSSLLAVKMGYSVALGAFVIGAVIAESRELGRIARLTEPLRDMFSAVFFVAIGMLIDPRMLMDHTGAVTAITLVLVGGKILSYSAGSFLAGIDARTSVRIGIGMTPLGEFSFIIAALGVSLGVTSSFLYPIAVAVAAVTTLITPYMIRSSDRVVNWCERKAPQPLVGAIGLYTQWVAALRFAYPRHQELRPVRSLIWQLTLNVMLIAGVFIGAAFASTAAKAYLPVPAWLPGEERTACWIAAVVLTLPIYVATVRKLQALGMMLAEVSITRPVAGLELQRLRALLSNAILVGTVAGLGVLSLLLSSAILPPGGALVALLTLVAVAVVLFGAYFNRLYSHAKFALIETWNRAPDVVEVPPPPMPALLRDADMDVVVIGPGPAAGKRVRDLAMRSRTGASIVAIERAGHTTVNPGPDELLRVGDQVLLLGAAGQLTDARKLLASGGDASSNP